MLGKIVFCVSLALACGSALGQEAAPRDGAASESPTPSAPATEPAAQSAAKPATTAASQVKTMSGMSILGNEEAPKSLVIVPWKSSEIGDGLNVEDSMDDRARAVDKEVFMREVHFYQLRSGKTE